VETNPPRPSPKERKRKRKRRRRKKLKKKKKVSKCTNLVQHCVYSGPFGWIEFDNNYMLQFLAIGTCNVERG
jgi:hypothetical protein